MATLTVRRLDEDVYQRLRDRARANNRSLEAEVRDILEERTRSLDALVDDLSAFHREMQEKHGALPDSLSLIREMRAAE